jgi:hypothetical protein
MASLVFDEPGTTHSRTLFSFSLSFASFHLGHFYSRPAVAIGQKEMSSLMPGPSFSFFLLLAKLIFFLLKTFGGLTNVRTLCVCRAKRI